MSLQMIIAFENCHEKSIQMAPQVKMNIEEILNDEANKLTVPVKIFEMKM